MEDEGKIKDVARRFYLRRMKGKTEQEQIDAMALLMNLCGVQFERPGAGTPLMALDFSLDMTPGAAHQEEK